MRQGPSLGASARKNAGDPDRERRRELRWRGSSGYVGLGEPDESTRNAANTDFVTKSFATRWTLRRILRPCGDHRRDGREVAAHEHDVGHAPRHVRDPLPWAIASRAALSAGTSFTPSPTIAT